MHSDALLVFIAVATGSAQFCPAPEPFPSLGCRRTAISFPCLGGLDDGFGEYSGFIGGTAGQAGTIGGFGPLQGGKGVGWNGSVGSGQIGRLNSASEVTKCDKGSRFGGGETFEGCAAGCPYAPSFGGGLGVVPGCLAGHGFRGGSALGSYDCGGFGISNGLGVQEVGRTFPSDSSCGFNQNSFRSDSLPGMNGNTNPGFKPGPDNCCVPYCGQTFPFNDPLVGAGYPQWSSFMGNPSAPCTKLFEQQAWMMPGNINKLGQGSTMGAFCSKPQVNQQCASQMASARTTENRGGPTRGANNEPAGFSKVSCQSSCGGCRCKSSEQYNDRCRHTKT